MSAEDPAATRFWALGEVVEIFERSGAPRAVVVLDAGAVIEVGLDRTEDVHLGDRVSVEGTLALQGVAVSQDPLVRAAPQNPGEPNGLTARHWRIGNQR